MAHPRAAKLRDDSERFLEETAFRFIERLYSYLPADITAGDAYATMKKAVTDQVQAIDNYFANYGDNEDEVAEFELFFRFYNPDFREVLPVNDYNWITSFTTKCDIILDPLLKKARMQNSIQKVFAKARENNAKRKVPSSIQEVFAKARQAHEGRVAPRANASPHGSPHAGGSTRKLRFSKKRHTK